MSAGTVPGQAQCWSLSVQSQSERHQPDWDLEPHGVHFQTESCLFSTDGALKVHNASTHGISLQQKHKQHEHELGLVLLSTSHACREGGGLLPGCSHGGTGLACTLGTA